MIALATVLNNLSARASLVAEVGQDLVTASHAYTAYCHRYALVLHAGYDQLETALELRNGHFTVGESISLTWRDIGRNAVVRLVGSGGIAAAGAQHHECGGRAYKCPQ